MKQPLTDAVLGLVPKRETVADRWQERANALEAHARKMENHRAKLLPVLKEFVDDCEAAAGPREVKPFLEDEWPDLLVTFKKAEKLLKEIMQ